jgi:hypothetical protein
VKLVGDQPHDPCQGWQAQVVISPYLSANVVLVRPNERSVEIMSRGGEFGHKRHTVVRTPDAALDMPQPYALIEGINEPELRAIHEALCRHFGVGTRGVEDALRESLAYERARVDGLVGLKRRLGT